MNKIDLDKNQLVTMDIKVKVGPDSRGLYVERYLAFIDHRNKYSPFWCWYKGKKGSDYYYKYFNLQSGCNIMAWEKCKLITDEEVYRVKSFYDLVETLKNENYRFVKTTAFDNEGSLFLKKMFFYCGEIVTKTKDGVFSCGGYSFKESWVEKIDEVCE